MATVNPARLAKIDDRAGRLAKGLDADYLVVRRGAPRDPYEALIYASPEDILLVAVKGRPLFGDGALLQKVSPSAKLETVQVCGAEKALDMSDSDGGKGISFAETMKNLDAAFHRFQLPMAGLCQ
jgi:adenine deaminase